MLEPSDTMLNEGQERLCQIASRTHFDDFEQAEIYKAMRAEDPTYKALVDFMRDTQSLPLEECAKLLSLRIKAEIAAVENPSPAPRERGSTDD